MKYVLILTLSILHFFNAQADCSRGSMSIFPSGKTIKQNSIFVIDGYGSTQKLVLGFKKKNSVYLKSGNKKVRLLVKEIYVGQFNLTQAVLTPEQPLEVGLEYELFIDKLSDSGILYRYNAETKENESVKYTVVDGFDTEKPNLLSRPKEIRKSAASYGCGPAKSVIFDVQAEDSSEIIIKTTVKNIWLGIETIYYVKVQDDEIRIGHGMCSGAFKFNGGTYYEVEFSIMDASGNVTPWEGNRIQFTEPISKSTD